MDEALAKRLQLLEDRAQIEELRATYCFLVDDGRFDELVDEWFTEDAVCDFHAVRGGTLALLAQGRPEVRTFFAQLVAGTLQDMCHTMHNHRIVVDGDDAAGDCYFELTAKDAASAAAIVGAGRYVDRYRRVDGRWRFAQHNAEIFYMAPLAEGWVQRPFLDVPLPTAKTST